MGLFGKKKTPEGKLDELYEKGMAAFNAGNHSRALELFEKAAKQGHANAQNNCGYMYDRGDGTAMDEKKAFYWYEKAAEQGHVNAMGSLGKLYYDGRGTETDQEKAFFWFQQVAKQGNADAQNNCGVMYENGYGVTKDEKTAFYWYEKAAKQGNADAMKNLGNLYYDGKGTEADMGKALLWSERAAERGVVVSQENCGYMYENGYGTEKDEEKAFYWYEKAAEQGNIDAQYNCGKMYEKGTGTQKVKALSLLLDEEKKNQKKAFYWYEKAAEQGHIEAQYKCGDMFSFGKGTEKDQKKALYWYEKAAEQGSIDAQYKYGFMYENGIGTEKDQKKALYWYEKAAEQGYARAQYNCGLMYENGCGTAVDTDKAFEWYEKAAKQGHTEAQEKIKAEGELLFFKEDYIKAASLLSIAAEMGRQGAWYLLGRMYADGLGVQKDSTKAKELFDKLPSTSIGKRYTIAFGTYPQGEHDEIEPIRWYVLDRKGDRLLLLSTKVLDARAYHGSCEPITWEKCDLRQWLNHAFMEKAFTKKEKDELIEEVRLENPDNAEYGTPGGSATTDRVFLLSIEDPPKYFNFGGEKDDYEEDDDIDIEAMEGLYTPYVGKKLGEYEKDFYVSDTRKKLREYECDWWLRSPGAKRETAACIDLDLGLRDDGKDVNLTYFGIRPALWLKLKP